MPSVNRWTILLSVAVGSLWPGGRLLAQERPPSDVKDTPPPVRRFFDRPIDYWQRGLGFEADKKLASPGGSLSLEPSSLRKAPPSEWGQIVKQPDGTMAYQELPRPLVDVLEDPSPEKIRAYFEWKLARTQKILRAAQAMKEYRSSVPGEGPPALAPAPEAVGGRKPQAAPEDPAPPHPATPGKADPRGPFTVTYFHRGGCPHCDTQDVILSRWLGARPEGKLVVVNFGEKPELWQKYGVRGTPSLVVEGPTPGSGVFLEGVSQESELEKALLESNRATPKKKAVEGGEK
jgi:hypothetical protein